MKFLIFHEPSKNTSKDHRGPQGPRKERPRDLQAPSRAPLETPLGPPRPPTNHPKTFSSLFKSPHSAKEGAQSLPNATQEAPKPQNTMKINENQTFFVLCMAHSSRFPKPSKDPQGLTSEHLGACKNHHERPWRRTCIARGRQGTSKDAFRASKPSSPLQIPDPWGRVYTPLPLPPPFPSN